jgi:hypothetical protein
MRAEQGVDNRYERGIEQPPLGTQVEKGLPVFRGFIAEDPGYVLGNIVVLIGLISDRPDGEAGEHITAEQKGAEE